MPCKGKNLAHLLPGKTVTDVCGRFAGCFKDLTFSTAYQKNERAAGTGNSDGLKNPLPSVSGLATVTEGSPQTPPQFAGKGFLHPAFLSWYGFSLTF